MKSLETKKLIKSVKCVNATKKKVYMLYDLEPDRTVTGTGERKKWITLVDNPVKPQHLSVTDSVPDPLTFWYGSVLLNKGSGSGSRFISGSCFFRL